MLAERAFIYETVAQRGTARGGIEGIAFPLIAPVAERFESIFGEQILRLGSERASAAVPASRRYDRPR